MTRYSASEEWLQRAEMTIPLGSQTFSKSRTQYSVGVSPLYAHKAKGAHLWDIDGNKYIDYVSALACVTLGYGDRGVANAIRKQLSMGISMSLPGRLEAEVAEKLVEMIPSAEKVRFGKNGTDATSAAIRLARAYTGRDHVLVCGYHGWQDWYIGSTTRDKGVPEGVRKLTHKFNFNNIESLVGLIDEFRDQTAAVIIEPMNVAWPQDDFLLKVRELCTQHEIILIFDEVITGFRFSNGGAQGLFNVTPDLSAFGKGMANGMPLSAVVGKAEIMDEMENVFFSGTFGGELLSLAAANHVLDRYAASDIPGALKVAGDDVATGVQRIIGELNLGKYLNLSGHPSWIFLNWTGDEMVSVDQLKTYFAQLMYENGILILNSHNVTLAHTNKLRKKTIETYEKVLSIMSKTLTDGSISKMLHVAPLAPLFKVR
jgi:glutamate-1-semialdehyde 2,1-aminomutase